MHSITSPWTLRFTEWECGHHQQRPEDIPCASPAQARAICWAIACAISQPGHARAILFGPERGIPDIYITDDYATAGHTETAEWEKVPTYYRPEVVLCSDQAMVDAILAPELKQVRDEGTHPDLMGARQWDGKELPEAQVSTNETVLTVLTREQVEERVQIADLRRDCRTDAPPPLFELPPIYFDGAEVLERLRKEAAAIVAWEAEVAAEREAGENAPPEGGDDAGNQ